MHVIRPHWKFATLIIAGLCGYLFDTRGVLEPRVGDIIAFVPTTNPPRRSQLAVWASFAGAEGHATGNPRCILDPSVMTLGGGSLIVEATGVYETLEVMVHWDGSRTSAGATNCGHSVDMLVSRDDLRYLAATAQAEGNR
jgi:hypothetical protein